MPSVFGWALTMLGTFGAWLCFYELNAGTLFAKLKTLATLSAYHPSALSKCSQTGRAAFDLTGLLVDFDRADADDGMAVRASP